MCQSRSSGRRCPAEEARTIGGSGTARGRQSLSATPRVFPILPPRLIEAGHQSPPAVPAIFVLMPESVYFNDRCPCVFSALLTNVLRLSLRHPHVRVQPSKCVRQTCLTDQTEALPSSSLGARAFDASLLSCSQTGSTSIACVQLFRHCPCSLLTLLSSISDRTDKSGFAVNPDLYMNIPKYLPMPIPYPIQSGHAPCPAQSGLPLQKPHKSSTVHTAAVPGRLRARLLVPALPCHHAAPAGDGCTGVPCRTSSPCKARRMNKAVSGLCQYAKWELKADSHGFSTLPVCTATSSLQRRAATMSKLAQAQGSRSMYSHAWQHQAPAASSASAHRSGQVDTCAQQAWQWPGTAACAGVTRLTQSNKAGEPVRGPADLQDEVKAASSCAAALGGASRRFALQQAPDGCVGLGL